MLTVERRDVSKRVAKWQGRTEVAGVDALNVSTDILYPCCDGGASAGSSRDTYEPHILSECFPLLVWLRNQALTGTSPAAGLVGQLPKAYQMLVESYYLSLRRVVRTKLGWSVRSCTWQPKRRYSS